MSDQQTPPPASPPAPSATEAQNQLNVLTADKVWQERFLSGDVKAGNEFKALTGAIVNGGTADDVAAAVVGGKANPADSVQRQMASTVELFRSIGIRDEIAKQFLSGEKVTAAEYQAVVNLKRELLSSADFVKDWMAGDVKAAQRMLTINAVITNGVKVEAAA